ncbi:pilus assembly protein [Paraburkholderia steynii]|uniref:Pilus assembly protein n=1 Tax=Paraburkholderia steynii TaxID=1245441 RepID=A0A4R0X9Z3_9BURK|nr:pilus assembly protein [Paraburkholderia steynii]
MQRFIRALSHDERGVSALEYAVLAGIVVAAVVAAGAVLSGSGGLQSLFTALITKVTNAIGT